MKVQYCGDNAVDIPGCDNVEPGAVVDVADEVGASLLTAGWSYPEPVDGVEQAPVAPEKPLWKQPSKKTAAAAEAQSNAADIPTDAAEAENGAPS